MAQYDDSNPYLMDLKLPCAEASRMMPKPYFYRTNADNTVDAICPLCFMTAATGANEEDVRRQEAMHRCPVDAFVASEQFKVIAPS
jgi:hypothetical protein